MSSREYRDTIQVHLTSDGVSASSPTLRHLRNSIPSHSSLATTKLDGFLEARFSQSF